MATYVTTNDGVRLHYISRGVDGPLPAIVLIHGWSGSHRYFDNSLGHLVEQHKGRVLALDLRFHGDSDKPEWGFHVARLAADLRDFLAALQLDRPVIVGSSLGCAILWSYVELFGSDSLGKLVFVDQAPSQWKLPDWSYGSNGIYDAASLANIQHAVSSDMEAFAAGNAACCLSHTLPPAVMETLTAETLKCDPAHLGKLMADHAPRDWRPILPRIVGVPCLNLFGTESGCFPVEGTAHVGELIPDCKNVAFDGCNHWLYLEQPERFAKLVVEFAAS